METSSSHTLLPRKLKAAGAAVKSQVQGLPHLLPHGRGRGLRAKLTRQWTMVKHAKQRGSVQCNVLPFMEISVAVQDTLDLVRSSIEEEIVFQATLQVPTHHAIACRIEAFGTPFSAPALHADPSEWTEDDHQFAACLASPPDVEEVPSFSFSRAASMVQTRAPILKEASALATLSFSVRQRQNNRQNSAGEDDLVPDDNLARAGSSNRSSLELNRRERHSFIQPAIAEDTVFEESTAAVAADDASAAQQQQEPTEIAVMERRLSRLPSRSVARLESFGPRGRTQHELELSVGPGAHGLASLVGVGYIIMQQWSDRLKQPGGFMGRNINTLSALLPPGGTSALPPHRAPQAPGIGLAGRAGDAPSISSSALWHDTH